MTNSVAAVMRRLLEGWPAVLVSLGIHPREIQRGILTFLSIATYSEHLRVQGRFVLRELRPAPGTTPDGLLATAASLERSSEHPLARALVAAADARGVPRLPVEAFRAHPGRGVEGRVDPGGGYLPVRAGTTGFVDGAPDSSDPGRTLVHVSVSGAWIGALLFEDALRAEARRAVDGLRSQGVDVEVLSGDRPEAVAALVAALPGVAASASLTPEDKLR